MSPVADDLWVFGYGSLVWRPSFPHRERRPALLRGFARRFWQGSTDHRGVPGAPGRVVTLVADDAASCHGMAYRIAADERESVLDHLDWREKGGYAQHRLPVELLDARAELSEVLVYVATEANPNYLGPASLEEIAAQVLSSHGPSGPNDEYVLRLAEALRAMQGDDAHVYELEALVRAAAA